MKSPVCRSINKSMLLFGIDRRAFCGLFFSCVFLFRIGLSPVLCVLLFFGLMGFIIHLTRKEDRIVTILLANAKLAKTYDPSTR